MIRIFYLFTLGFALLFSPSSQNRGWRGIEPLVSARTDVERLLGRCPQDDSVSCLYKTETDLITVRYADGPCEKGWPFGYDVPLNTVIRIEVSPLK